MKQRHVQFWIALELIVTVLVCPLYVRAAELRIPDDLNEPAPTITAPDTTPESSERPEEELLDEETAEPRPYSPLRIATACPDNVEDLSELLIRDLPDYANRVLQRTVAVLPWTEADELRAAAGEVVRSPYRPSHMLIAGNVNLAPLDLSDYAFTTSVEAGGPLTQLFFTTLSRQYSGRRFEQIQEYHWLFLTQTTAGWRMAFIFSQIDDDNNVRAPLPPRENSSGTVGQAVRLWLRDCRANSIEALDIEEKPNSDEAF